MNINKIEAGELLIKAFLKSQKLSDEEEDLRFEQSCSIDYWRNLNPQLTVCKDIIDESEVNPIAGNEVDLMLKELKRKRYFATAQPLISAEKTANMRKAVENIKAAGWHEAWCYVYDEFWEATRTPSLIKLLSGSLGANFKALPHVVVHYVHPETGAGWSPHIDFSDRVDRFTVWFAISDATLQNGCMYIVDSSRIDQALIDKWTKMQDFTSKETGKILQATKALPVDAGSILAWEGDVIHWGAYSSPNVYPRISLSVVYVREGTTPLNDEIPFLSPIGLPSYAIRMLSIGKAINYYNIHVLALRKYAKIGVKLVEKYKEQAISEAI